MPAPRNPARALACRTPAASGSAPSGSTRRRRSAPARRATRAAVEHLGYVQIDTINVIERSHHHILWSRIPAYRRADLATALSVEKSVFEYWAHALAYIPTRDFRFFMPDMRAPPRSARELVRRRHARRPRAASSPASAATAPLTIRDIDDDVLVDKDHPWASRKPSKRALQLAFFAGALTVSARDGMLKTYELTDRHFGWPPRPRPATEAPDARLPARPRPARPRRRQPRLGLLPGRAAQDARWPR